MTRVTVMAKSLLVHLARAQFLGFLEHALHVAHALSALLHRRLLAWASGRPVGVAVVALRPAWRLSPQRPWSPSSQMLCRWALWRSWILAACTRAWWWGRNLRD